MGAKGLIFKNTFVLSIGKAIGDLGLFLFLVYFGRSFGQDALGQYGFAMAVGGIVSIFISLGLNTYTIREISKDKRRGPEMVGQIFVLRTICILFCWGIIWLIAWVWVSRAEARQILLIISAHHFLLRLITTLSAGFLAHEEMIPPTVLGISRRLMILSAGSTGIYLGWSPALTLMVYPASAGLTLIAAIILFGRYYGWPVFQFNWRFIKTAMRECSPFLVVIILGRLYDRIGIVILTALQGEAIAGIYTAGDRILATINGFSSIFAFAFFPSVSRLAAEKSEQVEDLCNWALRMVYITLFPLASVLFVTSEQIIQLAFGEGFGDSAAMLRIICWSLVLSGFNRILAVLLIAYYKQGQLVRIRMAFYAGYFLISMGLVWQFSYLGLAWAKIITEMGILVATFYYAVKICPAVATLKKFCLPTTLCLGPTIGLVLTGYRSWLILVVFAVLFTVTGFFYAVIRISDFQFLKAWLAKQLGPRAPGDNSSLPQ